jgi:Mrp family chromosome partitioning ATPase
VRELPVPRERDLARRLQREAQPVISMSFPVPPDSVRLGREVGPVLGRLRNAMAEGSGVVVHLTAAQRGDGVSTLAREIAAAAAAEPFCRVLLLDASEAGEEAGGTFARPLPDLAAAYLGRGEVEVASVTAGAASFHATALRGSFGAPAPGGRSLRELHEEVRAGYDLVVVDCPPILESPFLHRLGSEPPRVVMVLQQDRTPIPIAIRAREEVALAGGSLIGVVLSGRMRPLPRILGSLF